ncbi:MAG: PQQ-binding-like beta-propeller repeat protein [Planctomycetaceae bacterium]|nr:PQQ-binding-like beta-propeller repeat protein [Planctomycetaceae bacterium]
MCVNRLRTGTRRLCWSAALVLLVAPNLGEAAELKTPDSSSWASFRGNLSQTGVAQSSLPDKLEKLWEIELGDQIVATSAIVGDRVYVPCLSGELACLDKRTGEKIWSYKSVEVVPDNSFAPGFKAAPTVTADAVYLGDEDGVFHAVDRATGKKRWSMQTNGEIYSAAAVVGERIIFGSYDNNLYCLNIKDGSTAWRFETQGYVHCAPAIADKYTFIAGCDEHLRVIDIETGKEFKDIPLMTYLIASPAVADGLLYVGTYASEVVAVDWKTGDVKWRYQASRGDFPYHSSVSLTEKLVVVGGRDKLVHGINRATGEGAWTFRTRARVDSSPVVIGDRVFIGSGDGNLYELGLADGQERWRFSAGKPITASPAIGEGVLVIGSESRDGKVYCFGTK